MVKENLLKEAILISKLDKNNNLEEKYLILEKYINLVKNDESLNNGIEKVIKYENQIENCKEEIKYIKKEVELEEEEINELENKESNEKEWLKYIENIIKEEIIKFEKEKKEEFLNNQGKEISNILPSCNFFKCKGDNFLFFLFFIVFFIGKLSFKSKGSLKL